MAFEKLRRWTRCFEHVAMRKGEIAPSFSFTSNWSSPKIILSFWVGPLALKNVSFLFADSEF